MRTIVVGDVHGCADELEDLLDRVAFSNGDRLIFVGDLVARGPASLRVLDLVRSTGAMVVRGNHEQKLLDYDDILSGSLGREPQGRGTREAMSDKPVEVGKLHRDLARELRPIDWVMLRSSRIWLDLPEHDLRVVHAGIDPAIPFENQSPGTMMRIRTVPAPSGSGKKEGVLWGERYLGAPHIVFGHNAAPGLQLHPWATGLDTGCVYGGRLTCLVLGPNQRVPRTLTARRATLVSVPARKIWFEPTRASA